MLTLTQHTTNSLPHPFLTLEAMLAEPFPRTPQDMMQLEQRLSIAAAQTADQIVLVQVTRAHEAVYLHTADKYHGPCTYLDNVTLEKSSLIKGLYGKCPGRLRTLPQSALSPPR